MIYSIDSAKIILSPHFCYRYCGGEGSYSPRLADFIFGSSSESVGTALLSRVKKAVDSMENPRETGFPTEPTAATTTIEFELEKIDHTKFSNTQ